jgi:hypothetical protein
MWIFIHEQYTGLVDGTESPLDENKIKVEQSTVIKHNNYILYKFNILDIGNGKFITPFEEYIYLVHIYSDETDQKLFIMLNETTNYYKDQCKFNNKNNLPLYTDLYCDTNTIEIYDNNNQLLTHDEFILNN